MPLIKGRDEPHEVPDDVFATIGERLAQHGVQDADGRMTAAIARAALEPDYLDWMTLEILKGNPELPPGLGAVAIGMIVGEPDAAPAPPAAPTAAPAPALSQASLRQPGLRALMSPPAPAGQPRAAQQLSQASLRQPRRIPQQNPAGLRALVGMSRGGV